MTEPRNIIESRRSWWAVSNYKGYKDFCKPKYIDYYLYRLVVYYSHQDQIVTGSLPVQILSQSLLKYLFSKSAGRMTKIAL